MDPVCKITSHTVSLSVKGGRRSKAGRHPPDLRGAGGSKVLSRAVRDVFDRPWIQRRQEHKIRKRAGPAAGERCARWCSGARPRRTCRRTGGGLAERLALVQYLARQDGGVDNQPRGAVDRGVRSADEVRRLPCDQDGGGTSSVFKYSDYLRADLAARGCFRPQPAAWARLAAWPPPGGLGSAGGSPSSSTSAFSSGAASPPSSRRMDSIPCRTPSRCE
ncbi:MAG: hypothetical protein JWQ95_121 [Sphaerisporangium sp.]|nr:hypothetical protein [Sphaerisporangium sp.]